MRVAVQEMGHLVTVQNILLMLGGAGAFHLQRDVLRRLSDKDPIPFVLEPVNAVSLAKYVAAERPAQVPPELRAKVDALVALAERETGHGVHRVGVLYELLAWMFASPAEVGAIDFDALAPLPVRSHISNEDLRDPAEIARYEALADEWQVSGDDFILATVRTLTREEARLAISQIAEQGEGLEDVESSHFEEFLQMVDAFDAGNIAVKPIATSPVVRGHGDQSGAMVSHPYARLWAEVFNLQYELLVLTIFHALNTPRRPAART